MPQAPVEAPASDRAVGSERPAREPGLEPQDAEPSSRRPGAETRRTSREASDEPHLDPAQPARHSSLLTAGTAVFVAAEFSLTALERSTVDANAETGGWRDKLVQRAHRTLSFQLSGAQLGISITTLVTGYLAEPLVARLLHAPAGRHPGCPTGHGRRRRARAGAADRHLGVDGVRRTGPQEPRRRQAAADGARACAGPQWCSPGCSPR